MYVHVDRYFNTALTILFHGARQGEVCFRDIGKVCLWNSNKIASHVGIIKLQSFSATDVYGSMDVKVKKRSFQA